MKGTPLSIIYLGGKQVGLIGLLTVASYGCWVKAVVPRDEIVGDMARKLKYPTFDSVEDEGIRSLLPEADLLVSVHSKEIIPLEILNIPRLGGINVHPCLYKYKGRDPIRRFLCGGDTKASVGAHFMTEEVDCGEVVKEIFVEINREEVGTVAEVYNVLYPVYGSVLFEVLEIIGKGNKERGNSK